MLWLLLIVIFSIILVFFLNRRNRPVRIGLESVYLFADCIKRENFSVASDFGGKDLTENEIESLCCEIDKLDSLDLYELGIILYENPTVSFRKEYCICFLDDEFPKIFMVFNNSFLLIPYSRQVHYSLVLKGFSRIDPFYLFREGNLNYLKSDSIYNNPKSLLLCSSVFKRYNILVNIADFLSNNDVRIWKDKNGNKRTYNGGDTSF